MAAAKRLELKPRGMVTDQPDHTVAPENYTGGTNIMFRNGRASRCGGWASVWQDSNPFPGDNPQHLLYAPHQGTAYWAIMGDNEVFITEGVNHSVVTPAGGLNVTEANQWTASQLNDLAVFNNSLDPPFFWSGDPITQCETLPDFPANTTCTALRPYKFHLVALGIDGPAGIDNNYLLWSDAAAPLTVPQSWTIETGSQAGDNVLGDEPGALVDGLSLRDDFIIYKKYSTYIMTFVGGLEVMAFRKFEAGTGIMNRNCVVEHGGFHYVLADGDVVKHDGQTQISIADKRVREFIFTLMDANLHRAAFLALNPVEKEIWVCIPTGGVIEARSAAVYSIDSDTWSFRDVPTIGHATHGTIAIGVDPPAPQDWDTMPGFWNFQNRRWNQNTTTLGDAVQGFVMAQPGGAKVFQLDADVQIDGETLAARLEWLTSDLGQPGIVKTVQKIWPLITASNGAVFQIRVGGQMTPQDGIAFETRTFTVGTDEWVDVIVVGKYISIQIETDQDTLWDLDGFGIQFSERARF